MIKVTYRNFDGKKKITFISKEGILPYGAGFLWRDEFYYFDRVGF